MRTLTRRAAAITGAALLGLLLGATSPAWAGSKDDDQAAVEAKASAHVELCATLGLAPEWLRTLVRCDAPEVDVDVEVEGATGSTSVTVG